MEFSEITKLAIDALLLMLLLSLPPVLLATVTGLLVSLIQALTQIQEQNLPFAIKLISVVVVMVLLAPWMAEQILSFTESVYSRLALLSG